jgi:ribonuclease D
MSIRLAQPEDLEEAAAEIAAAPRVAVDTEFHAERRYLPRLYLLQVHVEGGHTWILDPLMDGGIRALGPAMAQTPWVVHGGQQDIRILFDRFGAVPEVVLDTQIAAALVSPHYPLSYQNLVSTWLERHVDKRQTMSDWSRRPLSSEQIAYAAADATELLELWDRIAARADELGRMEHVAAACCEQRDICIAPQDRKYAWHAFYAAAALDEEGRKAISLLTSWRLDEAEERDVPPRSVLSDGLVVTLSRERPVSVDAMRTNRRMPKGVIKRHGTQIVSLLARARSLPDPGGVPPFRSQARLRLGFLDCVVETAGAAHKWAPRVVAPERIRHALALDPSRTRINMAKLLGPWRDDLCGSHLHSALTGSTALRMVDDLPLLDGSTAL